MGGKSVQQKNNTFNITLEWGLSYESACDPAYSASLPVDYIFQQVFSKDSMPALITQNIIIFTVSELPLSGKKTSRKFEMSGKNIEMSGYFFEILKVSFWYKSLCFFYYRQHMILRG